MITPGPEVTILAHEATMILAQNQSPGTPGYNDGPMGPEFGKASPIGIPVILLLLIVTVLLIRNMNKHIKGLPESFDAEHPEPDQLADEGTDRAGVAGDADADRADDEGAGTDGRTDADRAAADRVDSDHAAAEPEVDRGAGRAPDSR